MDELEVKYALNGKAIPPQPIRLKIGDWAGSPQKMVDGSEPQPWHCLPFVEASTYALELIYPYETECHVVGRNGTIEFDWDFAKEPGGGVNGAEFVIFSPRAASKYYFFNTGMDIQPPEGHVLRTEPHPRYFTDDSGTVPLPMIGHLQNEWYSRQLFVVCRGPRQGQRHIFRKGEPFAQILFVPQKVKYRTTPMPPEEQARRRAREASIGNTKAQISENIWHNPVGTSFNDHYKVMARAFGREGLPGVEQIIGKAEERYQQALPSDKPIAQCLAQGNQLMDERKYNEAAAIFNHVLTREPNNADAMSRLAIVYWCNQMTMVAIQFMSKAAAIQPPSAGRYADLGQMLQMVGRLPEAEAAFRAAVQLNPNDALSRSHLGLVMARQGRFAEGLAVCQAASAMAPTSPVSHCALGTVLAAQGQTDQARACFDAALALDSDYADARRGRKALPPEKAGAGSSS